MQKYKKVGAEVVEAVQWYRLGDVPEDVVGQLPGRLDEKDEVCTLCDETLGVHGLLAEEDGVVHPGDWIIFHTESHIEGLVTVEDDDDFAELYEPLGPQPGDFDLTSYTPDGREEMLKVMQAKIPADYDLSCWAATTVLGLVDGKDFGDLRHDFSWQPPPDHYRYRCRRCGTLTNELHNTDRSPCVVRPPSIFDDWSFLPALTKWTRDTHRFDSSPLGCYTHKHPLVDSYPFQECARRHNQSQACPASTS